MSLSTEAAHFGHSEHFAPCVWRSRPFPGRLVHARITIATKDTLLAEAA